MEQSSDGSAGWDLLLHLPADILVNHVLVPYLSPRDKQALRQTSRLCRSLANAAVGCCVLDAYISNDNVQQQLPSSFPNVRTLRITCTHPDEAKKSTSDSNSSIGSSSSSSGGSSDGRSSDNIPHLQAQLPAVLTQLPCLTHLVYEGPRDRRQPGLNMTAALQALAAAVVGMPPTAAAAAAATAAAVAAVTPRSAAAAAVFALRLGATSHAEAATMAAAAAAAASAPSLLRALELTAGSLPDALMEAVGGLTGLVSLKLNATAAIHMVPVAKLTGLTSVTLTVTPPLPSAIWPLSRLTKLSALQLSALSPARGWGTVLARLAPACPVDSLTLSFADIGDEDIGAMSKALTGLSYLNLNYSRHLSATAVTHLAALPKLSALHLQETGLTLGHEQLVLLGTGCTCLHTLEATFDLRAVPLPYWAAHRPVWWSDGVSMAPKSTPATPEDLLGELMGRSKDNSIGSGWPPLQKLVLYGVTVADFDKLIVGCRHLTNLVLHTGGLYAGCMLDHLAEYLRQPPPLQEITVSGGGPLKDSTCSQLGRGLPFVKGVTLSNMNICRQNAGVLLEGVSGFGVLESLSLHKCVWLDDGCLRGVIAGMTHLRRLEITQCDSITAPALLPLAGKLPLLTRVVVRECKGVGPADAWEWERLRAAAAAAAVAADGVCCTAWAVKQEVVFEP